MMYLWIKIIHLLALISWMAGLFYLPRLFVYHVDQVLGSASDVLFKTMERRLLLGIMRPAALVTLVSGFALAWLGSFLLDFWLWAKLAGVLGLFVFHGLLERYRNMLVGGWRGRSSRYFRVLNEIPTLLLIWIVIWVVLKP